MLITLTNFVRFDKLWSTQGGTDVLWSTKKEAGLNCVPSQAGFMLRRLQESDVMLKQHNYLKERQSIWTIG